MSKKTAAVAAIMEYFPARGFVVAEEGAPIRSKAGVAEFVCNIMLGVRLREGLPPSIPYCTIWYLPNAVFKLSATFPEDYPKSRAVFGSSEDPYGFCRLVRDDTPTWLVRECAYVSCVSPSGTVLNYAMARDLPHLRVPNNTEYAPWWGPYRSTGNPMLALEAEDAARIAYNTRRLKRFDDVVSPNTWRGL